MRLVFDGTITSTALAEALGGALVLGEAIDSPLEWMEALDVGALLWVPSAVLPAERHAILNPAHPDYPHIRTVGQASFVLDPRLRVFRATPR